jgi:hypothetical protein
MRERASTGRAHVAGDVVAADRDRVASIRSWPSKNTANDVAPPPMSITVSCRDPSRRSTGASPAA